MLANDKDPNEVKRTLKAEARIEAANTIEAVARKWLGKKAVKQVDKTRNRNLGILELNIF